MTRNGWVTLLLGFVTGFLLADQLYKHRKPPRQEVVTLDDDGDGIADVVQEWKDGKLSRVMVDRAFSHSFDHRERYTNGIILFSESDDNGDHTNDVWVYYDRGRISRAELDTDFNGNPDETTTYKHGLPSMSVTTPNGADQPTRVLLYTNGVIYAEATISAGLLPKTNWVRIDPFGVRR